MRRVHRVCELVSFVILGSDLDCERQCGAGCRGRQPLQNDLRTTHGSMIPRNKKLNSDCRQTYAAKHRHAWGDCEGGDGSSPFTFNPCQNGNFFGSFHFGDSSCRHFVDSLRILCVLSSPLTRYWRKLARQNRVRIGAIRPGEQRPFDSV